MVSRAVGGGRKRGAGDRNADCVLERTPGGRPCAGLIVAGRAAHADGCRALVPARATGARAAAPCGAGAGAARRPGGPVWDSPAATACPSSARPLAVPSTRSRCGAPQGAALGLRGRAAAVGFESNSVERRETRNGISPGVYPSCRAPRGGGWLRRVARASSAAGALPGPFTTSTRLRRGATASTRLLNCRTRTYHDYHCNSCELTWSEDDGAQRAGSSRTLVARNYRKARRRASDPCQHAYPGSRAMTEGLCSGLSRVRPQGGTGRGGVHSLDGHVPSAISPSSLLFALATAKYRSEVMARGRCGGPRGSCIAPPGRVGRRCAHGMAESMHLAGVRVAHGTRDTG